MDDRHDRHDRLIELIFDASFISLATADADGVPWCSPLEFVCDEDLRLYWVSKSDTRHSANLRINPRAAVAIFDSRQTPGAGLVSGVWAEGTVDELDTTEVSRLAPTVERWHTWRDAGRVEPRPRRSSAEDSAWRVHRLTPTVWYALEPATHPTDVAEDSRVRVDLIDAFRRRYRTLR